MGEMQEISAGRVKWLKSLRQKKYRDKYGLYLIEGEKTIKEAIASAAPLDCIICAEGAPAVWVTGCKAPVFSVGYGTLRALSDTKNPQPYLAYVKIGDTSVDYADGLFVALDGLADPYNVGTIIRTADAFGAIGVMVSNDSCDIYNPKVQRAAMGSMFHINTEQCALAEKLMRFKSRGCKIIAATPHGRELPPQITGAAVLVIGSEAKGVSRQIAEISDSLFKIGMPGAAESLNAAVAAGIAMYIIQNC